jgi:hypothetical protein
MTWPLALWHFGIALAVFFVVWGVAAVAIALIDHSPRRDLAIGAAAGISAAQAVIKRLNK